MIGLATSTAALLVMQAAPVARPALPWDGEVQVFRCTIVGDERSTEEYVLTLTNAQALLVGQAPGQAVRMDMFVPFESLAPVVRGKAAIRRLQFSAGEQIVFVRQLYQGGQLQSTFLSLGANAREGRDLPFETFAGFCSPTQPSLPGASQ